MSKKDERVIRRDFDLNFDGVNLKAYTETIDGQEVKFLGGTASSTAKDLYGDIIAPSGQVKMLEKLTKLAAELSGQNSGLTAWVNHQYKIPEDTLGAFVGASLTTRDDDGETFIDLDIKCRVTETNPRALAAWQQVKDGIRHGWSIGAYFLEAEWLSDDPASPDYWSLYVTDLNLIEISLVGIPANQRAWCKNAADMKAKAVEAAERITREASEKGKSNMGLRQFVQRSLLGEDAETRRVPGSPNNPRPEMRSEGDPAVETPAQEVPAVQDPVQNEAPKTADSTTTAPIVARTFVTEEELRAIGRDAAVKTLRELQDKVGDENGNGTRLALEVGIWAIEKSNDDPVEMTELSVSLREAAGNDPAKLMLAQAADAIDALSKLITAGAELVKRDSADGDGETPNGNQGKISLAISHLAKSVGHGLCVRGGGHIAKAIDCLAAAVPEGDGDPDQLAARIEKLELQAGDVLIVQSAPQYLDSLRGVFATPGILPDGVKLLLLSDEITTTLDADLASRALSLTETNALLESRTTYLVTTEASIAAKSTELSDIEKKLTEAGVKLAELEAKIAEAKDTRLGRKSPDFAELAAIRNTAVDPSAYPKNETERVAAIAKMLQGEGAPSGRDMVAGR
jgi:hypothetical protein